MTLYVSCDHTLAMKPVHYTLRRQAVYGGMFALLLLRCSSESPPSPEGEGGERHRVATLEPRHRAG